MAIISVKCIDIFKIWPLKDDIKNKEDKENKLLEVLVNRGDQIRSFKAQDKEKDEKIVVLNKNIDLKKQEIAKLQIHIDVNNEALLAKTKEIDDTNTVIQQFKLKLSTYDAKIQDNVTRFMEKLKTKDKALQEKTKEVQDKDYIHKKEIQKIIIDCNEKIYTKDQQLKEKALEHGRKMKEKSQDYEEKLKDKESKILELNQKISEKVLKINEKVEYIRKRDIQIREEKRKFDEKVKEKDIDFINSQRLLLL